MAKIINEKKQQELKFSILKGCCPYCLSKVIKYHEFIANSEFGFECLNCGWHQKYSHQELEQFFYQYVGYLAGSQDEKP